MRRSSGRGSPGAALAVALNLVFGVAIVLAEVWVAH
jgi:hypothetical protein